MRAEEAFIEELKALLKKHNAIIGLDYTGDRLYIRVSNFHPVTLSISYIDHKNLKL